MSKKSRKHFEELVSWFPNLDRKTIDSMMSIIGPMLAALPGGDEFEDLGYEPLPGIGWQEYQLVTDALQSIGSSHDIEEAAQILLHSDDEDDEDMHENPAFMRPEYVQANFAVGEVDGEYVAVPWEYRGDQEWDDPPEKQYGYWAHLSAPSYLDQTEWEGPFDSLGEAKEHIANTWDVDPDTGESTED